MTFITQNEILALRSGATLALKEVRSELGLPKSGDIVFPKFYLAKHCYHLIGKQAADLKKAGYQFALGILIFGGPHMYFLYKLMDAKMINLLFGIQILMFVFYMYKRHLMLRGSNRIPLLKRPLLLYTGALGKSVSMGILVKGIVSFLVFFALMGGFFTYSVFINGYYILFLFMLGSLLWLSVGAIIMALSLKAALQAN